MKLKLVISLLIFVAMLGCIGHHDRNARLHRIAEMVSDAPESAIESLDSIDSSELSESDRHYKDFLTIKANDKAYIVHQSDSLVLDVLDYAEDNQNEGWYPEALYYGGRVYSDLGDFPTALRYYQKALDHVPSDKENADLKSRILVQTARVLDRLRLYDDAIGLMEEALDLDVYSDDSEGLAYDLQLIGNMNLRAGDYVAADRYFAQALEKGEKLPDSFQANTQMLMAAVKNEKGRPDSALMLIRGTQDRVNPVAKNTALAYAASIYLRNGISDTAFAFAKELIDREDENNKKTGYRVLLSPEMANCISSDTLTRYVREYADLLSEYYNDNASERAMMQQNMYNYAILERDKAVAERKVSMLLNWLAALLTGIMVLCIIILILKLRNKNNLLILHQTLDNLSELRKSLNTTSNQMISIDHGTFENGEVGATFKDKKESHYFDDSKLDQESRLRLRLRENLLALYEENKSRIAINSAIYDSEAHSRLLEYVANGRALKDNDSLWEELEKSVFAVSPNFKRNLQLLVRGRLTVSDYRTALLIRCGIGTVNMASLLCLSKGAIVSRRSSLAMKVFDEKTSVKVIDGVICCL